MKIVAALLLTLPWLFGVQPTPALAAPGQATLAQQAPLPQVQVSVSPTHILVGQTATASLRGAPGERLGLWAYTLPNRTYRLVRLGTADSTGLTSWVIRPNADTRLYGTAAGGARQSGTTVLQVRRASPIYNAPLRTAVRQLRVAVENNAGYDRRRYFGHDWIDADRDCRNTRQEVLASEGTGVRYSASSGGCTVSAGTWRSFYDNRTYTSPTQLQIDHLVPIAEAWGSGARTWTQARRVAFFNDLGAAYALNAMPSSLNQSKQASGPER